MSKTDVYRLAVERLKAIYATRGRDQGLNALVDARDGVFTRYQPIFSPDLIDSLRAEDMREFLVFRNNRHWTGLQRMGPRIVQDMEALREGLRTLLDESVPVSQRLDALLPGGKARVRKLSKAVLTPILLITHPDRYGVWNGTSEAAMQTLDIWPVFDRGQTVGRRYERINEVLLGLVRDVEVDLWTLDALWWRVLNPSDEIGVEEGTAEGEDIESQQFGLERHLQDFLIDNWENTKLGQEWDLVEEGGDIRGYGSERPTDIGRIDLLARHKKTQHWLVVELKRGQTSDDTVGQVLRYMGWVQEKLAQPGEQVEGLVIGLQEDEKLRYALRLVPAVRFLRYEVQFRLHEGRA